MTVVIPVYNSRDDLERCLRALAASTYSDYSVLVVDDGSTDDSVRVAREHRAEVLSLDHNSGPAVARNRGAAAASGDVLFFIDADVCVQAGTLKRAARHFAQPGAPAAVIGSYDAAPADVGFLSQYKNLQHHFVHQDARDDAFTFWSGCGAIRRDVFLAHGGFDENFRRPCVEDIELGYRLRAGGERIRLDKSLRVKHLKRWTFRNMVRTDFFDRAVPWTELILRTEVMPADLNLQHSQRLSVTAVYVLAGLLVAGVVVYGGSFLLPWLAMLSAALMSYAGFGSAGGPRRLWPLASIVVGTGALAFLQSPLTGGLFAGAAVCALLGGVLANRARAWSDALSLTTVAASVALLATAQLAPLAMVALGLTASLLALNARLYGFFRRTHGIAFACAAVPFHWLYFAYSGLAFGIGIARHILRPRAAASKTAERPLAMSRGGQAR